MVSRQLFLFVHAHVLLLSDWSYLFKFLWNALVCRLLYLTMSHGIGLTLYMTYNLRTAHTYGFHVHHTATVVPFVSVRSLLEWWLTYCFSNLSYIHFAFPAYYTLFVLLFCTDMPKFVIFSNNIFVDKWSVSLTHTYCYAMVMPMELIIPCTQVCQ